jgi:hypothetical protein
MLPMFGIFLFFLLLFSNDSYPSAEDDVDAGLGYGTPFALPGAFLL